MKKLFASASIGILAACNLAAQNTEAAKPKRINKAIELLEQGQPIYYTGGQGGFEEGRKAAFDHDEGSAALPEPRTSPQPLTACTGSMARPGS